MGDRNSILCPPTDGWWPSCGNIQFHLRVSCPPLNMMGADLFVLFKKTSPRGVCTCTSVTVGRSAHISKILFAQSISSEVGTGKFTAGDTPRGLYSSKQVTCGVVQFYQFRLRLGMSCFTPTYHRHVISLRHCATISMCIRSVLVRFGVWRDA